MKRISAVFTAVAFALSIMLFAVSADESENEKDNVVFGESYSVSGITLRGDSWDDSDFSKLTDGIITPDYADTSSICGMIGREVDVVFYIGKNTELCGFSASVTSNSDWGIESPKVLSVEYLVSLDGEVYTSVGCVKGIEAVAVKENADCTQYDFFLDEKAIGKYIKIHFSIPEESAAHLWVTEIQAFKLAPTEPIAPPEPSEPSEPPAIHDEDTADKPSDNGVFALWLTAVIALACTCKIMKKRL